MSYLVLCAALLPLPLHQSEPLLQTGPLHLQSLCVVSQGPQADPQLLRLLPAPSQSVLPHLPSLQQGRDPGLVPALQGPHAAAEPPLQSDGSLAAQGDVAHGAGRLHGLVPQGMELVLIGLPKLGQLLGQALDVGLELLLRMDEKLIKAYVVVQSYTLKQKLQGEDRFQF